MTRDRAADVGRFRGALARGLGLQFDDGKVEFLAGVLERRLAATRLDAGGYLDRVASRLDAREVAALAPELTVAETYFFRHADQFRALTRALTDRVAARRGDRRLQLLSAGCASGEEAYSLAMAARDVVPAAWDVGVRGVDLNPAVIEKAKRATYTDWALRETTPEMARRWFTRRGRECELDASIRAAVRFDARNLIDDDAELWAPGSYDIVFIRNVLMYFEPAQARAVMARIERAVRPGGFLFLGHAETLRGLSSEFDLRHTDDTFYYQRHDGTAATVAAWDEPAATTSGTAPAVAETWVDVVHRTAARIERLAEPGPPPAPRPARPRGEDASAIASPARGTAGSDVGGRPGIAPVRACLRDERYGEAAAALAALPAAAATDPDVLLHAAVVETHRGRLPQAEAACARLLADDAFNAGAHYVLALCREAAGELARRRAPRSGRHLSRSGLRHAAPAPRPAGPAARRAEASPGASWNSAATLLQREPERAAAAVRRRLRPREPGRALPHRARSAGAAGMIPVEDRAAALRAAFDRRLRRGHRRPTRGHRAAADDPVGGDPYALRLDEIAGARRRSADPAAAEPDAGAARHRRPPRRDSAGLRPGALLGYPAAGGAALAGRAGGGAGRRSRSPPSMATWCGPAAASRSRRREATAATSASWPGRRTSCGRSISLASVLDAIRQRLPDADGLGSGR